MSETNDAFLSVPELIASRGFRVEEHEVETEDGYLLTLHRIINPLLKETGSKAKVVLLQHGLGNNAREWLVNSEGGHLRPVNDQINGPLPEDAENNLGFALANEGFDVWMNNTRGNEYSMKHKTLDPSDPKFWEYSVDELIQYDQPAVIDYILATTSQKNIGYVGISQGTTIMFGLLSTRPEYNEILKPIVLMAPVYNLSIGVKSPYLLFLRLMTKMSFVSNQLGKLRGHNPGGDSRKILFGHRLTNFTQKVAFFLHSCLCGFNYQQVDEKRLGIRMAAALNARTSMRNTVHYLQSLNGGNFRKFDFGKKENVALYGQKTPPEYSLEKITSKSIALIYSKNDWSVGIAQVDHIKGSLKVPLLEDYLVSHDKWDHVDYLYAKDSGKYVNSRVIQILNSSS